MSDLIVRKTIKAVGVTFNNPDGESRQDILRELAEQYGQDLFLADIELQEYQYQGKPAYHIVVDQKIVGNISADLAAALKKAETEQQYIFWLENGWLIGNEFLEDSFDDDEEDDTSFYDEASREPYYGIMFTLCLASPDARAEILKSIDAKYSKIAQTNTNVSSRNHSTKEKTNDRSIPPIEYKLQASQKVPVSPKKKKLGCFGTVAVVLLVFFVVGVIMGMIGKNSNNAYTPEEPSVETSQNNTLQNNPEVPAKAEKVPEQPKYSPIEINLNLTSGYYVAGIDFPSGTYDIVAISGNGNVSSDNMFNGGINAMMGVDGGFYEPKYQNIKLPEGTTLSISNGVTINIFSKAADGAPLKTRVQPNSEEYTFGSGYFVAGQDFAAGVYDIAAISGDGNVSSDNLMDGGINAMMGVSGGHYESSYKNVTLTEGVTLSVSNGVTISLVPSK